MSLDTICRMQGLDVITDGITFFAFKAFYSATGSYQKTACVEAILLPGFKVGFKLPVFYAKINPAYDPVEGGKTYVEQCVAERLPCFVNERDEICFAMFENDILVEGRSSLKIVGVSLRATFSFSFTPHLKDFLRSVKEILVNHGCKRFAVKTVNVGEVCSVVVKCPFRSESSAKNAFRDIRNCVPGNQKRVTLRIKAVKK
jgi:hypothetical protein